DRSTAHHPPQIETGERHGKGDRSGDRPAEDPTAVETRRRIFEAKMMLPGDRQAISRMELSIVRRLAVDLDAVLAVEVDHAPVDPVVSQLAVSSGNLRRGKLEIAIGVTTDDYALTGERQTLATINRDERRSSYAGKRAETGSRHRPRRRGPFKR